MTKLNITQIAEREHVEPRTVYYWFSKGLKYIEENGVRMIDENDLIQFKNNKGNIDNIATNSNQSPQINDSVDADKLKLNNAIAILELNKKINMLELDITSMAELVELKKTLHDKELDLTYKDGKIQRANEQLESDKAILVDIHKILDQAHETLTLSINTYKEYEQYSKQAIESKNNYDIKLAELENVIVIRHKKLCAECQARDKNKCEKCKYREYVNVKCKKDYDKWVIKKERGY